MDQDGVSRFGQNLDSASNAAVDAIFIADHVPCQFRPVMTGRLPVDDALVIGIRRQEVTKKRVFQPLFHGLDDSRASREIHVRYPHGDFIETGLGLIRFKAPNGLANAIESRSIFTSSVNNRRKIVFHLIFLTFHHKSCDSLFIKARHSPSKFSLAGFLRGSPYTTAIGRVFFQSSAPLIFLRCLSCSYRSGR